MNNSWAGKPIPATFPGGKKGLVYNYMGTLKREKKRRWAPRVRGCCGVDYPFYPVAERLLTPGRLIQVNPL